MCAKPDDMKKIRRIQTWIVSWFKLLPEVPKTSIASLLEWKKT